jgi:hypothetical protein
VAGEDALDVALLVAAAIERAGGEYFVGGSVASSLQGEPRATNDIDFVVSLARVGAFATALGPDFEVDQIMLHDALTTGGSANIFFMPFVTKVDIFGLGREPFDRVEFARRKHLQIRSSGERLWIKTSEDTVLRKLLWFRAGGEVSEKQWRDVVGVLRVGGPDLDHAYLDDWAGRLDLAPLLARARAGDG